VTRAAVCAVLVAALAGPAQGPVAHAQSAPVSTRIVSLSSAVTEILYAVGAEDRLVAVAQGVHFPPAAAAKPMVGPARTVTAEPILAQRPTLVIGDSTVPAATVAQLRAAGVTVALVGDDAASAVIPRIRTVGALVGRSTEAAALADKVQADLAALRAASGGARRPRVLFIYARGAGNAFVGGRGTGAHDILELAGATNAAAGVSGYRPLTAEAVAASGAEVIVLPSRGLASVGGPDGLLALPGIAQTPAGRARRIVAVDDQLMLGFGPRVAEAARQLAAAIAGRPAASGAAR
jgi:iron complex transport system substrate-binding protein